MTPAWCLPFLEALRATGIVARACRAVGVGHGTVYALRRRDGDFAAAWDDALEESYDTLEAEARRRATEGVAEPIVHQGQFSPVWERDEAGQILLNEQGNPIQALNEDGTPKVLTKRVYSDQLLQFLLKGYRKKFGTERTELTGADGGPVQAQQIVIATGVPQRPDADFSDLA